MINPIGLKVEKIHACSNDCILYYEDRYKDLDACPGVKLHGTWKGYRVRVAKPEEGP
jgi:hypothetical protein